MVKKKGEEYECEDCGLVVLVQNPCECGDECQLVCCQKPMRQRKTTKAITRGTKPEAVKSTDKTKR